MQLLLHRINHKHTVTTCTYAIWFVDSASYRYTLSPSESIVNHSKAPKDFIHCCRWQTDKQTKEKKTLLFQTNVEAQRYTDDASTIWNTRQMLALQSKVEWKLFTLCRSVDGNTVVRVPIEYWFYSRYAVYLLMSWLVFGFVWWYERRKGGIRCSQAKLNIIFHQITQTQHKYMRKETHSNGFLKRKTKKNTSKNERKGKTEIEPANTSASHIYFVFAARIITTTSAHCWCCAQHYACQFHVYLKHRQSTNSSSSIDMFSLFFCVLLLFLLVDK